MGSTSTSRTQIDMKQYGGPVRALVVTARNLVPAIMVSARKALGAAATKLFGVTNAFGERFSEAEVIIEGGDVARFLKQRTDRFGVAGITIPTTANALNDAIVHIAQQLVEAYKGAGRSELNDEQFRRIALEYVTSACCAPIATIEPFPTYLARSRDLRKAVKALNQAQRASTVEAFSAGSDLGTIERLLEQGRQAWATITRLLGESTHLATLRTQFNVPPLFTGMEAWQRIMAVSAGIRPAVLNELRALMRQSGNPYVDVATVEYAIACVAGTTLLTVGNTDGVTIDAAIEAMAGSRMQGVQPDGGAQVGFDGTPAFALGDALRGLNGYVRGTAKRKDGKTIGVEIDVTEGASPTAAFTAPIAVASRAPIGARSFSAA